LQAEDGIRCRNVTGVQTCALPISVNVITDLISKYGQFSSGNPAVQPEDGAYNNSFIIADKNIAYVLETVGKHFMAKEITEGTAAISNQPSIRTEWDLASE